MTRGTLFLALVLAGAAAAVRGVAQADRTVVAVTDAMLQKPDPAYWLMWRRTLDSSGYSPLDQITDSVNGKQYVAVSTGPSLVAGATARLTPVPDSFGVP